MTKEKKTASKVLTILYIVVVVVVVVALLFFLFPVIVSVLNNDRDTHLIERLRNLGVWGVVVFVLLQSLQIITIFLPMVPFSVLSGLCYGVVFGTLINVAGTVLGNTIMFTLLRQFSKSFSSPFNGERKRFLQIKRIAKFYEKAKTSHTPEIFSFALAILPIVPNGFLPYIFVGSKISLSRFLISIALASVPSSMLLTVMGNLVAQRNFIAALVTLVIYGALCLVLYLFRDKVSALLEKI